MLDKKYVIYKSVGNFADIVFTSNNYNDCQDYLQQRADMQLFLLDPAEEANAYLWNCCSKAGLQRFGELARSYEDFEELQEYFPEGAPKEAIVQEYIDEILEEERL